MANELLPRERKAGAGKITFRWLIVEQRLDKTWIDMPYKDVKTGRARGVDPTSHREEEYQG